FLLRLRFGKTIDGDATTAKSIFEANTFPIRAAAVGFNGMGAGEGGRAQQTAAEPRALFIRPVDHAHRNRRTAVIFRGEPAQNFERRHYSETSIEPAAVRHRIQ